MREKKWSTKICNKKGSAAEKREAKNSSIRTQGEP